jgi:hypothetical protein
MFGVKMVDCDFSDALLRSMNKGFIHCINTIKGVLDREVSIYGLSGN